MSLHTPASCFCETCRHWIQPFAMWQVGQCPRFSADYAVHTYPHSTCERYEATEARIQALGVAA